MTKALIWILSIYGTVSTAGTVGSAVATSAKLDTATERVEQSAPSPKKFNQMAEDIGDIKTELVDNRRSQNERDKQQDKTDELLARMIDKCMEAIEKLKEAGASREKVDELEKQVESIRNDVARLKADRNSK